ncbi:winged helix-turn-helix transcriptional regulator [Williamsia maris]|uniref:Transcriptional regulator, HxlR family n=1 Tax=Williamsia maris TaxID=72806 RepID=A0ABT1HBE9_9NOCA|nr:helix-turn-helix domain-containing protein [Williamsia maris]MCP2175587.1 transcriptional regulator, HxlR family [Williamsia maris]
MSESLPAAADCFVRLGVELIAHQWDAVVLTVLRSGPSRRAALVSAIGGISDKSLHESLRRLRESGLVEKDEVGNVYRLTELGESFATGPVLTLAQWAEANHGELTD